ncbi:TerB N-terminal domain-containing protein (plasmid) [Klebsiella pneumoniae]
MELLNFLAAIFVIYLLFFRKKKRKSPKSYASDPVKAPPKEWLADIKKKEAVVRNDDSEDDNLATFTLSGGRGVELRVTTNHYRNTSKSAGALARWVLPGEMITVAGVAISGGHIYVGQRMKPSGQESGGYYDDGSEASLIDDTCKIKPTSYLYEDSSLGYWPSFSFFPQKHAVRMSVGLPAIGLIHRVLIGYVFIYLYGLERKALVDSTDPKFPDAEFRNLFNEVARLRLIFIDEPLLPWIFDLITRSHVYSAPEHGLSH